jgi:hypothetical protein
MTMKGACKKVSSMFMHLLHTTRLQAVLFVALSNHRDVDLERRFIAPSQLLEVDSVGHKERL